MGKIVTPLRLVVLFWTRASSFGPAWRWGVASYRPVGDFSRKSDLRLLFFIGAPDFFLGDASLFQAVDNFFLVRVGFPLQWAIGPLSACFTLAN